MRNRSASKFNALRFAYTSKKHSIAVHSCELLKGSQSYLPKLPPNAKYFVRLKRQFQKMILVSAKHPYTRFYLRSHAAIAFEKKRHGRSPHWWVVHPCSIFRFYWDLFMLFILLHLVTAIPHMLAYAVLGDSCRLDSSVLHVAFAFCWMDIVVNCITGFMSADEHEIYLDPGLIMRHYSRGFFLVDVLSSIPYSPCSEKHLEKLNVNFVYIFFQLLPLLKVFRLATVRQYIKKLNAALGISDMCDLYIWIVVLTTLICHWSACLSYGFPHFVKLATRGDIRKMGVWFVGEHLQGIELWELYLRCLHVGASNLWSFDFSEVTYEAIPDRIVRCVLLIFGKGYTIYVIVALLQLIESHAEPEMKYHKMMYQVQDYARQKKLPKELHDRLVEYYEYRYQGSYYKESGIINTLPS